MFNNDCMITIGNNILQTFDRMEVAEYSAKATIAAQAFGGMTPINEKQVADLVKAFNLIP
jgi:L-fuculose-phosphate aldolase